MESRQEMRDLEKVEPFSAGHLQVINTMCQSKGPTVRIKIKMFYTVEAFVCALFEGSDLYTRRKRQVME